MRIFSLNLTHFCSLFPTQWNQKFHIPCMLRTQNTQKRFFLIGNILLHLVRPARVVCIFPGNTHSSKMLVFEVLSYKLYPYINLITIETHTKGSLRGIKAALNICVANGGWALKDLGTETNNPNPGRWNTP